MTWNLAARIQISLLFLHAKAAAHTHIRAAFSAIRAKQLRLAAGAVFAHTDLIRRDPHQLQLFLIDSFDVDMAFAVYHVFRRSGDVIFCKRPVFCKSLCHLHTRFKAALADSRSYVDLQIPGGVGGIFHKVADTHPGHTHILLPSFRPSPWRSLHRFHAIPHGKDR